jgi:exo-beta-1,3-glucanase (GH17 family)
MRIALKRVVKLATIVMIAFFATGCWHNGPVGVTLENTKLGVTSASTTPATQKVHGLDFGPYIGGQDPHFDGVITESKLTTLLEIFKPYTEWIRNYGSTEVMDHTGAIAHRLGFKTALSAWIDGNKERNTIEVDNLIKAAQAGEADMVIVGSEVFYRGDLKEHDLLKYIKRVKQAVAPVPVAYADVYSQLLKHPAVIDAVDVVLVNYYPYWEGIKIDHAVGVLQAWHQQVLVAVKGKPVIISETGWPSAGDTIGEAVPSAENASFYFLNFVSWARANNVNYFYFEVFDEPWKAQYEGPQGAHWGIFDQFKNLKPGMQQVFNGQTVTRNWTLPTIPGGPGDPDIKFTSIAKFGSFDDLYGQVRHVDRNDYKVAVYIYVSGWWTKPTFANPLASIRPDGSWTADITTGGVDERATRIAAFLLPDRYTPSAMAGEHQITSELEQNAVAKIEIQRSP